MSSAYQLKPWTQVAIPHQDILDGKLDNSVYAAKLGAVVRQDPTCPPVYRSASQFFAATYLTSELKSLLTSVVQRLCGDAGDRVLQLRTPFGGGKTHALISLYHLTKHRQDLVEHADFAKLPNPGTVDVATFIGDDFSATKGTQIPDGPQVLTPWGYLAWQLGGKEAYEIVRADDEQRVAPGNDVWRKIIGDRPTLILLDEFLNYVENALGVEVKDSTLGKQVLTFIKKLPDVVAELPRTVLVYSLQASVQEAVGNEGLLGTLDKLVSRNDAKKEPVSGDEVMKVVQRRLFQTIGDPTAIQEIAKQQAELFRKFHESYAETDRGRQEIQQQAALLAERIQISYPFHPDLLDLMYHRWGTLPSYQRTRGALQFLASVVYSLWQEERTSLLISPGDVLFQNEAVRGAFFTQVGERERYNSVIDADLIGRKAKVKIVDNRLAQDSPALSHLKVGTRLASAVLMYSFGARSGEDRGVLEQEITASCLTPGLDRNVITATLSDLRENLLYLHYVGKRYRFETKANLNKLIADEESKISGNDVLEKIREELGKTLQSSSSKVVLWPKDSSAIPDREPQFSVAYLGHEWAEKSPDTILTEVMSWLEQRGNDKREYKNALAFVIPNKAQIDKARKAGRTAEAIASLIKDKAKYKFSPEDLEELNEKRKDALSDIGAAVRRLYDYILLPIPNTDGANPIRLETIDLQAQLNTSQNLQDRVLDALKNHVFGSITTTKLMRLSGLENSEPGYITGDELVSYFFRFPTYPKVLGIDGVKQAIVKAVQQGLIGYVPYLIIASNGSPKVENPSLVSIERNIPSNELDLAGYLLAPQLAKQLSVPPESEKLPELETQVAATGDKVATTFQGGAATTIPVANEGQAAVAYKSQTSSIESSVLVNIVNGVQPARHYKLEAITDKSKFFELFSVLQSLSDRAEDMTIKIEVRAHTTQEFDRGWIRGAIEEPLDELDIQASTSLE
ncbi:MAG: ATP-binding protein [Stenomitos frigidus ULC029]